MRLEWVFGGLRGVVDQAQRVGRKVARDFGADDQTSWPHRAGAVEVGDLGRCDGGGRVAESEASATQCNADVGDAFAAGDEDVGRRESRRAAR